jgi:hypothetical protein
MQKSLCSVAVAATLLLQAGAASAQSGAVIDLRNLKPRELRSAVFTLTAPQGVRVEAVGSRAQHESGTFSWVSAMWNGKEKDDRRDPWMGNAWILDLKSRRVVWELSASTTERSRRGTRTFDGTVRLPAGTYEAFYGAFPNWYWASEDGDTNAGQRFLNWLHDAGFEDFRLTIHADHRLLTGADAERARREIDNGAIVTLRGDGHTKYLQSGFILDRATEVEIYAAGEASEGGDFDAGWIINADTRAPVWKLTWRDSAPAGGAAKNRMDRFTKMLPAGRYAAFYSTDDSHDPTAWNAAPPHDPHAWGLAIRVADAGARAAVKPFTYEHVPAAATLVALTRVGDSDTRSRGFTLDRAMDVRVYALGEGTGRLVDYGWIINAATRQKVWEMRYDDTTHAGGASKNRLVDRVIRLEKGNYVVHYVTDDSHSFDDWNAPPPADTQRWGITLLAAAGAAPRGAVTEYAEQPDPNVLAQLVRLRDDGSPRTRFSLDRESQVRIYALGEGTGRTLADYGWIEDTKTGRTVWEMTYRVTEPAGGASKNRRFDGTITLPAGEYVLRYETDGSHAFGSWNATPPDDPDMWGITVYRIK